MSKTLAAITGVNGWLPETVMTNFDLEKLVDTNDEWIRSRTGISERRILKEEKGTSYMATKAVEGLLEKTGTDAKDIDLIICATVTPDMPMPSTSNLISRNIGADNAFSYDIGAACSGFLYALTTGAMFIESGRYKKVIVVGADKMSSIIDYTDRATCIIFGDGAGAVLLEPSDDPNLGIKDSELKSDGNGVNYLHIKSGGSASPASAETVEAKEHFIRQEGRAVFKMAVTKMPEAVNEIMDRNSLTSDDLSWLVPHQANKRIIDVVGKNTNIPSEKVMVNINKYGNTTAGTLPLCLWDYEKQLKKGDNLILTAFGGGFTWGAVYLTWAYDGK
ncbi:MAG: beta-ketoacyl-ACP synthase III [Saprospiraceae bacterium]